MRSKFAKKKRKEGISGLQLYMAWKVSPHYFRSGEIFHVRAFLHYDKMCQNRRGRKKKVRTLKCDVRMREKEVYHQRSEQ